MSGQVYYIWDDTQVDGLNLGPQEWKTVTSTFYGGTTIYPPFSNNGPAASMSFKFSGTAFGLYGNDAKSDIQVSIDGNANTASTSASDGQIWREWYKSPSVSEGDHSVSINNIHGLALDLVVVTPGPNTPLSGKTLLIDDAHPDVKYNGGGWRTAGDSFQRQSNVQVNPVMGGVHRTGSSGDSMSVSFTGTNLRILGALPSSGGSYELSFSVDGSTPQTVSRSRRANDIDTLFETIVDTGRLSAGRHTVEVTLTKASGMDFVVDYILYSPSFDNLQALNGQSSPPSGGSDTTDRPDNGQPGAQSSAGGTSGIVSNLTRTPLPTGQSSGQQFSGTPQVTVVAGRTVTISQSGTQSVPTAIGGNGSGNGSTGGAANPAGAVSGKSGPPISAIIGGVLGGVIILLLILMVFLCRRRQKQRVEQFSHTPWVSNETRSETAEVIHPVTSSTPTDMSFASGSVSPLPRTGKRAQARGYDLQTAIPSSNATVSSSTAHLTSSNGLGSGHNVTPENSQSGLAVATTSGFDAQLSTLDEKDTDRSTEVRSPDEDCPPPYRRSLQQT